MDTIFVPEVEIDKIVKIIGMNISIITNTREKEKAFYLLKLLGMPFNL